MGATQIHFTSRIKKNFYNRIISIRAITTWRKLAIIEKDIFIGFDNTAQAFLDFL